MNIRIILASIFLGISFSAAADFTVVVKAYEVPLSLLRVPTSTSGTVTFSECETCEKFTVPVNGQTEFLINGQPMLLKDFRKSLFRIRDRSSEVLTVKRDLRTNTITAIKVSN